MHLKYRRALTQVPKLLDTALRCHSPGEANLNLQFDKMNAWRVAWTDCNAGRNISFKSRHQTSGKYSKNKNDKCA